MTHTSTDVIQWDGTYSDIVREIPDNRLNFTDALTGAKGWLPYMGGAYFVHIGDYLVFDKSKKSYRVVSKEKYELENMNV